ncbi:WD repeat-containing protein on Y chromosome-like [Agrilus planipennis]|uniref:WD repeat-containing protein on Y chromosome-like n=1 Tax=Agrilus planipennis TaxID=224129 RepID=A0A1W4WBV8_AGRPL|nr:WD repeat-containing protein on Y chromosome-like [Agrilus planipennis]
MQTGNHLHSVEAVCLFKEIDKTEEDKITRDQFIDYLVNVLNPTKSKNVQLVFKNRFSPPHVQEEPIQKIVPIQSEDYFCYCIVSKFGGVGVYDVNLSFLSSYRITFTRDDLKVKVTEEKIRRNRWVTDCIYLSNVSILALANSTRTITLYDAARLKHYLIWMITNIPNVIQCLHYSYNSEYSTLLMGDEYGQIYLLKFINVSKGLLRKKHTDKPNVFFWQAIQEQKEYVLVSKLVESHDAEVRRIFYCDENLSVASCSRDPKKSVIMQHVSSKWKPYIFKMKKGVNCFILHRTKRILITGSTDGIVAVWDIFNTKRPTSVFSFNGAILDLVLLNNFNMLLTYTQKGKLELWDTDMECSVQTLRIKFPKNKRWGDTVKYFDNNLIFFYEKGRTGHLRDQFTDSAWVPNMYLGTKNLKGVNTFENWRNSITWNPSHIYVINSNYVANIHLKYPEKDDFNLPVLHPPPLHNSVLIPLDWKICTNITTPLHQLTSNETDKEQVYDVEKVFDHSAFTLDRPSDINWRLSQLDNDELVSNVPDEIRSAVFLNLKLQDLRDIRITPQLLKSENEYVRNTLEKISTMLENASRRDKILYEDSDTRSCSRSSTNSLIEFL